MLAVILHEAAEEEMVDAILWYEGKEPGLGAALREQIETAISKIQRRPMSYQLVKGSKVRRILIERFPYSVFTSSRMTTYLSSQSFTQAETRRSGAAEMIDAKNVFG